MRAQHLAAHRGQGGRRRPDARRAARRHGPRRHPGRRDGDGDDPRRLQGAQGRARRRRPRRRPPTRAATDGRRGPPRDARLRLHRGPLPVRPPVRAGRPGRGERRRRAARGRRPSRPPTASTGRTTRWPACAATPRSTSSSSPSRTTSISRRSGPRPRRARASLCTKPLGRNAAEAAEMLRLVQDAGVFHGYLENEVFSPEVMQGRRDGRVGRARTGPHDARARGPLRAARGALLGRRDGRRRRVPGHGLPLHRGGPLHHRQGRPDRRGLRLGRDARPRRQDDRRGQRHRDPPLRGRPHGHDRGVVDGQGRDRGPQRGLLRARTDRPRPRLDADPGLPPGVRSATSAEKTDADTGWVYPVADEPRVAGYDEQMRHFVEAYRAGVEPRETFEDGLVVNSVIDAAYRSMRQRPLGSRSRSRPCRGAAAR